MTEILSKQSSNVLAKEESLLNWNEVLKMLKKAFGNDVYESWIKKLKLVEEFQHYLVLSSPTRFIRDWVVSRYIDKILEIIKLYKKTINKIDFIIESELSVNNDNVLDHNLKIEKDSKKSNVSFIEDSLINYTRLNSNKNFENFGKKQIFEKIKK